MLSRNECHKLIDWTDKYVHICFYLLGLEKGNAGCLEARARCFHVLSCHVRSTPRVLPGHRIQHDHQAGRQPRRHLRQLRVVDRSVAGRAAGVQVPLEHLPQLDGLGSGGGGLTDESAGEDEFVQRAGLQESRAGRGLELLEGRLDVCQPYDGLCNMQRDRV